MFSAAAVFLVIAGTNPIYVVLRSLAAMPNFFSLASEVVPWWLAAGLAALLIGLRRIRQRAWQLKRELFISVMLCAAFASVFSLVKNHMPALATFWADPILTRIDAATSGKSLMTWLDRFPTDTLLAIYFNGWVLVATFLPAILCLVDRDETRRRVFTLLWAACWVGLGQRAGHRVPSVRADLS